VTYAYRECRLTAARLEYRSHTEEEGVELQGVESGGRDGRWIAAAVGKMIVMVAAMVAVMAAAMLVQ
jgi:hypothetical protein